MNIREKALEFATAAHQGQKRKDGKDYITHPIAVAEIAVKLAKESFGITHPARLDSIFVISLLHDVIEDTPATLDDIGHSFGLIVALGVKKLTRTTETYFDFIISLTKYDELAAKIVKLADLRHNMSDLNEGTLKDKYRFAEYILLTSLGK